MTAVETAAAETAAVETAAVEPAVGAAGATGATGATGAGDSLTSLKSETAKYSSCWSWFWVEENSTWSSPLAASAMGRSKSL